MTTETQQNIRVVVTIAATRDTLQFVIVKGSAVTKRRMYCEVLESGQYSDRDTRALNGDVESYRVREQMKSCVVWQARSVERHLPIQVSLCV